jgi:hypothetical protein
MRVRAAEPYALHPIFDPIPTLSLTLSPTLSAGLECAFAHRPPMPWTLSLTYPLRIPNAIGGPRMRVRVPRPEMAGSHSVRR